MITICFIALPALSAQDDGSSSPIVLMLLIESEGIPSIHTAVRNELAIELPAGTLLTKSLPRFSSDSLSAKIEELRQIAVANGAEVVIWLEKTNEKTLSLQLVAAVPGRSMLRSVSAQNSGDAAGELAIAAHDMLKEVQISLSANHPTPGAVASPTSPPLPTNERNIEPDENPQRHLGFSLVTTGGFSDTSLTPLLLGGTVSVGFEWKQGLVAQLSLTVFGIPSSDISGGKRRSFGIRPGLDIGYLWRTQFISMGPYLGLEVPWQMATVSLGDNRASKDSWWNLRFSSGIDFRFRLHQRIFASVRPGLSVLIHREVFEKEFDGNDIYVAPYFEWNMACAVIAKF